MSRWKLCTSTTFEILPLSSCTLCKQKSYISKGFQPIFEILASARTYWGWAFGWKVSQGQEFYFCNGKVKTLRIDNLWNFATFNLYTMQAEILYLQRYSTNFRNLCFSWTMLRVGIWVESFRCAGIFLLQWQGENLAHRQHLKFCHFQPVPYASRNPVSPKEFNRFLKCLPQLEDVEGGHLGWKFQARRYFTFAMARWKLGASTTFEIMLLSTCTLCKQKSYISKDIQPIFEIFASARRGWWWPFGWKVSCTQVFYFCNGEVRILRIDKILNFGTFNLYTVQGENLYLQRYSTDFRNLYPSSQMLTVAFWAESFRCAHVLFCNGKVKILRINNILNFATFNLYTVQAEILYLQRYSTDFRNLSVSSKMLRVAIWVESFKFACILLLQWQGENFAHRQHLKLCYFQPVHCASKNSISPWYSTDFWNLCLNSKMLRVGICVESFKRACVLLLQWQGENLAHRQHLKFCHFQPVHCSSRNPISPKIFNQFS